MNGKFIISALDLDWRTKKSFFDVMTFMLIPDIKEQPKENKEIDPG